MDERTQFRRLLRSFSFRFLDNELLSAEGDSRQTMVHTVALIAALGITLSLSYFYKYEFPLDPIRPALRDAIAWGDREFLISIAMAVTGIAAVVLWDALFPDRRECLTLSALPVRGRTVFLAKTLSVVVVFLTITAALNGPTALFFPWIVLGDRGALAPFLWTAFVHLTAVFAASAFVFFTFLCIQGLLINVLSFQKYKWISTWVQLGSLFTILCLLFLVPNIAHPVRIADPRNATLVHLLPSFWFLGLYEQMLGSPVPIVRELAAMARTALAISAVLAIAAYSLGYKRYVRKTIEEAEALPTDRRRRAGLPLALQSLIRDPVQRAVFLFAARTMARNRKHRLLLAIYAGLGLGYVFDNLGWLLDRGRAPHMRIFDSSVSSAPLILSFFLLLGMRVLFAVPVELQSNWIFRLTENGRPAAYLAGVRKLMIAVGVAPLALGTFPIYGLLWGWSYAARHVLLVALILLVVVEYLMRGFQKVPFTCSFLPGKANLKAKFGWYCVLFLMGAFVIGTVELSLVRNPSGYWKGALALAFVLLYRAWRRIQWERRLPALMYEEKQNALVTLEL
jgi:hypothetical protein